MKIISTVVFLFCLFILISLKIDGQILPERQWPGYRGYFACGVLDNTNLPDIWDGTLFKNVKWKIEIPGLGLSSPVVWGEKLFITTAISQKDTKGLKTGIFGDGTSVDDDSEHEWKIFCIDKNSGKILWEKTPFKGKPLLKRHPKSSHANCTAATDGKYVVAFFGSEGLYCYDTQGNEIWKKNFGKLRAVAFNAPEAEWEFASSPVIYNGKVIIQCDVLENSFLAAFDVKTGSELWKIKRDEYPGWCTPTIYQDKGNIRIALNGYKHRGGYDFNTGQEIWKMSGGGDVPIPTPVLGDGLIYFNSAHGKQSPVFAVKTDASGDITLNENDTTSQYVLWARLRGASYMQTMLLYGNYLFNCQWNGTVSCYNAKTGKELYKERLGKAKSFTSSPVASDGKIYVTDDEGMVYVLLVGDNFKLLTTNPLGDFCMTTPAISDHYIFFRTNKYLIAVTDNTK